MCRFFEFANMSRLDVLNMKSGKIQLRVLFTSLEETLYLKRYKLPFNSMPDLRESWQEWHIRYPYCEAPVPTSFWTHQKR